MTALWRKAALLTFLLPQPPPFLFLFVASYNHGNTRLVQEGMFSSHSPLINILKYRPDDAEGTRGL